jgi:hypothetical protein
MPALLPARLIVANLKVYFLLHLGCDFPNAVLPGMLCRPTKNLFCAVSAHNVFAARRRIHMTAIDHFAHNLFSYALHLL